MDIPTGLGMEHYEKKLTLRNLTTHGKLSTHETPGFECLSVQEIFNGEPSIPMKNHLESSSKIGLNIFLKQQTSFRSNLFFEVRTII